MSKSSETLLVLDRDFSNLHPLTVLASSQGLFYFTFLGLSSCYLYVMHIFFIIPVRLAWQLGNLLFADLQKAADGPHSSPSVLPLPLAALSGSGPWCRCVGSAVFHKSRGAQRQEWLVQECRQVLWGPWGQRRGNISPGWEQWLPGSDKHALGKSTKALKSPTKREQCAKLLLGGRSHCLDGCTSVKTLLLFSNQSWISRICTIICTQVLSLFC